MNKLTLQAKEQYGSIKLYPHCEQSKLFARLAGTKTLTDCSLHTIKQLGYQIQVLPPVTTVSYQWAIEG